MIEGICEKCGLPKNICVCGEIAKEVEKIRIRTIPRRFGKIVTLVSGFDKNTDVRDLLKTFKRKLACGGTLRGEEIELQGEHKKKAKELLLQRGYKEGIIDA